MSTSHISRDALISFLATQSIKSIACHNSGIRSFWPLPSSGCFSNLFVRSAWKTGVKTLTALGLHSAHLWSDISILSVARLSGRCKLVPDGLQMIWSNSDRIHPQVKVISLPLLEIVFCRHQHKRSPALGWDSSAVPVDYRSADLINRLFLFVFFTAPFLQCTETIFLTSHGRLLVDSIWIMGWGAESIIKACKLLLKEVEIEVWWSSYLFSMYLWAIFTWHKSCKLVMARIFTW